MLLCLGRIAEAGAIFVSRMDPVRMMPIVCPSVAVNQYSHRSYAVIIKDTDRNLTSELMIGESN